MPSNSAMAESASAQSPRPLYVAESLPALKKFSEYKRDNPNTTLASRLERAARMFDAVLAARRDCDEERLFVLSLQFTQYVLDLRRSLPTDPSADVLSRVGVLHGRVAEVMGLAETAKASLQRRYAEYKGSANTPATGGDCSTRLVPANKQSGGEEAGAMTVQPRQLPPKADPTPVDAAILDHFFGTASSTECLGNASVEALPNTPGPSTSAAAAAHPMPGVSSTTRHVAGYALITPKELFDAFEAARAEGGPEWQARLVIVDARDGPAWSRGQIDWPRRVSLPSPSLVRPLAAADIGPLLDDPSRAAFAQRSKARTIVLYDQSSTMASLQDDPNHPLFVLHDALFKFEFTASLSQSPLVLDGGYAAFSTLFPSSCHVPAAVRSLPTPSSGDLNRPSYPSVLRSRQPRSTSESSAVPILHSCVPLPPLPPDAIAAVPQAQPMDCPPSDARMSCAGAASDHPDGIAGGAALPLTGMSAKDNPAHPIAAADATRSIKPTATPFLPIGMPSRVIRRAPGASVEDNRRNSTVRNGDDHDNDDEDARRLLRPSLRPLPSAALLHRQCSLGGERAALPAAAVRPAQQLGHRHILPSRTLPGALPLSPTTDCGRSSLSSTVRDPIRQPPVADRSRKPPSSSTISALDIPAYDRSLKPQPRRDLVFLYGDRRLGLVGLRNLGNTCYMNSMVQCLSHTVPLTGYFMSGKYRTDLNRVNPMGLQGRLADEYGRLVLQLWGSDRRFVAPAALKDLVAQFASQFDGADQHDSQEFLAIILDGLHEDLNAARIPGIAPPPLPEIPDDQWDAMSDVDRARFAWERHRRLNRSFVVDLFEGQFRTCLQCRSCGYESVTFTPFMYLSLPIPKNGRPTLQACLSLFTEPEVVSGADQWYCPKCKQHREAVNRLELWALPRLLMIHLKRFAFDGPWRSKINLAVDFPVSNLDMSPFVKGPLRAKPEYNLYAVSNHFGTMEGGHYTAFCRNAFDGKWYNFDDSVVGEAGEAELQGRNAYVLFYSCGDFEDEKRDMFSRPSSAAGGDHRLL